MTFLLLIGIGILAGFVATRMMGMEADLPTTLAIGVGGAILGWLALRFLATAGHWLALGVAAVGGAMLIVFVWLLLRR